MKNAINYYIAEEYGTAMYSGFATSKEHFATLCKDAGFDITGMEIELIRRNSKDEMGRPFLAGVRKDLGTL